MSDTPQIPRTFREAAETWLAQRDDDDRLAAHIIASEKAVVEIFLLPEFGSMNLADITPEHIAQWCTKQRDRHTNSTTKKIFSVLRRVLAYGCDCKWYPGPSPYELAKEKQEREQ